MIPARLQSTRLKRKVLVAIAGEPMLAHVWRRACRAGRLAEVLVACDHSEVKAAVEAFGGVAVMTSPDHLNGSSRLAEVAAGRSDADIIVNIQGDEPLIAPENIDLLVSAFEADPSLEVSTLAIVRHDEEGFCDPNVVKVVCDVAGNALYFSRSPIPYGRDQSAVSYRKHLGIYAYRRDFLLRFAGWPAGKLESHEKLEQLRMLENGTRIRVLDTEHDSPSVDTPEDLQAVNELICKVPQTDSFHTGKPE